MICLGQIGGDSQIVTDQHNFILEVIVAECIFVIKCLIIRNGIDGSWYTKKINL